VAQYPQQSLPRAPLFFAKRLTQIGQHEQLKLLPAFAKRAAPDVPAAHLAGKNHLDRLGWTTRRPVETLRESQFIGSAV
jgi:hypothetical protein